MAFTHLIALFLYQESFERESTLPGVVLSSGFELEEEAERREIMFCCCRGEMHDAASSSSSPEDDEEESLLETGVGRTKPLPLLPTEEGLLQRSMTSGSAMVVEKHHIQLFFFL